MDKMTTRSRLWIDAHCHLCDPRLVQLQELWITEAIAQGGYFFQQAGVGPEDWSLQLELKARYPKIIGTSFGLHPYWIAAHELEECESAMQLLAEKCHQADAIGECGLDFRPHIMKDSLERQIDFLQAQIELAEFCAKPLIFHFVQAHEKSLQMLDWYWSKKTPAMVHAFNGSEAKMRDYVDRGLSISIGGAVCRPENQKLHQAVKSLPNEYLLIETDAPDQPPPQYQGQLNPLVSILEVVEKIGQIKKLDPLTVLDISRSNFQRIFLQAEI